MGDRRFCDRRVSGAISGILIALALGCDSTPPAPVSTSPAVVRLTTGVLGGSFYPIGQNLARAYAPLLPDIRVQVRGSPGSVQNVETLQQGTADVGLTYADVAYLAFIGRLAPDAPPFERLRGIAVLQLSPLHLVAAPASGIQTIADLGGRRVAIGPVGSGTALTAQILLSAHDLPPPRVHTHMLPFNEAATRLIAGQLDAAFVNAGYPAESVARMTRAGARLVPVAGATTEEIRREYPFFRRTLIPARTYARQPASIHTIGVETLLVCREDLDNELVYRLTRAFFEALPELALLHDSLRSMDLEQAPATPIPLHDGAARYYRERELFR